VLETAVHWLTELIFQLGYVGIALLMALESSLVPFPSEVVLPPAGYLAAQGRMSAPVAFGAGLLGSLIGALFNYFLAAKLGKPVLHKYGKFLLIKEASLVRAEEFFRRHGEISMFIGRLIPVIRQLISLPAGVASMRLDRFVLYTALGAGIWCAILTWIGWYLGRYASNLAADFDQLVAEYAGQATLWLVPAMVLTIGIYVYTYRRKRKSTAPQTEVESSGEEILEGGRAGQ
jgi:membrane protein DedA with SNARE-associated domain